MLIVKHKQYIKKHVIGGAGIFSTVAGFFKRLFTSNAAQSIASTLSRAAASDIGKTVISAGKELATSAISAAKDRAIEKVKQNNNSQVLTPEVTQNSKDLLANLIAPSAPALLELNSGATGEAQALTNLNRLLAGQGIKSRQQKAIRIEELVRKLNGGGLRLAS